MANRRRQDQLGDQIGQLINPFRPSELKGDVFALDGVDMVPPFPGRLRSAAWSAPLTMLRDDGGVLTPRIGSREAGPPAPRAFFAPVRRCSPFRLVGFTNGPKKHRLSELGANCSVPPLAVGQQIAPNDILVDTIPAIAPRLRTLP